MDLDQLLENYVNNYNLTHPNASIVYSGTNSPVLTMASDYRVEQMMDKIMDNALDFHRKDTTIRVQLDKIDNLLRITVANRGRILSPSVENSLFRFHGESP